ncbi:hypothetical protein OHC33_009555 [Knufia fluminis]|uniref:Protein kinase domain-containing protein n=1 Tax=Knufia fluminis TaxID=191047 RepID=A0AAN8I1M6_9EURO|nr:hypothetical protein OHC33_009555 [Knufia fluminis]
MSDQSIFFDEGPGFLLVKFLGSGAYGCAVLVYCIADGQYYIRKEDLRAGSRGRDGRDEICNAFEIRRIPNVARLRGWLTYMNSQTAHVVKVTYWTFYNGGTINEMDGRSRRLGRGIPVQWMCSWLMATIDTMLQLHRVGFTHNDGHSNNWFLHNMGANKIPAIVLGDFGLSTARGSTRGCWASSCRGDFAMLARNFSDLIRGRAVKQEHRALISDLMRFTAHMTEAHILHRNMSTLYDRAKALLRSLPAPCAAGRRLIKDGTPEGVTVWSSDSPNDFRSRDISRLKFFKLARVNGQTCKVLGRPRGQNPLYHKHRAGSWMQQTRRPFLRIVR